MSRVQELQEKLASFADAIDRWNFRENPKPPSISEWINENWWPTYGSEVVDQFLLDQINRRAASWYRWSGGRELRNVDEQTRLYNENRRRIRALFEKLKSDEVRTS